MYSTCLICNQSLGANETIEHFPVGDRLAFDAKKGRLWVVCHHCGRWNLSPIEERWEAIEECERSFRGTLVRVSTDNIGLAKMADATELIRIGTPLRPEFAAWRYGQNFGKRRRQTHVIAGAGLAAAAVAGIVFGPALAPALATGALSIVAVPGLTTVMGVVPMIGVLAARDYIQHDRVVARLAHDRRVLTVRAKHLGSAQLESSRDGRDLHLAVQHDTGWAEFDGTSAMHATGVLISGANRFGAGDAQGQRRGPPDRARRRRPRLSERRRDAHELAQRPHPLPREQLSRTRRDASLRHGAARARDGGARGARAPRARGRAGRA